MADKTLVLDLLNVDKTILLGACVTVKFDREVDVTGVGRIPDPASTPLSMQDPPPAIIIPASDSDALAARSQGFCVIVNAVWTPENSFREASKTWKIQVTSGDPDTVRLSDKPNVVPVPPAQQVFDWDGARADITETKALAAGADNKSDTAVTTAKDAKDLAITATTSQDTATANNINTGAETGAAISRTVSSVQAARYGVTADGSTDDRAALAAAISDAQSRRLREVILPSTSTGIYLSPGGLAVPSGMRLVAPDGTLVKLAGAVAIQTAAGSQGVTIEGINFNLGGSVSSYAIQASSNTAGLHVLGCTFTDTGAAMAVIETRDGTSDISVEECTFTGCSDSIRVNKNPQRVTIRGNRFTGWSGRPIYLLGSASGGAASDITIERNTIINPATMTSSQTRQPICFSGDDSAPFKRVTITGNRVVGNGHSFTDSTTPGMADLISLHQVDGFTVTGNHLIDGGDGGLTIALQCTNGTVTGNVIRGNDACGVYLGSDTSTYLREVTVTGNTIMNNGQNRMGDRIPVNRAGVWAYNASSCVITGNRLGDNQATPTQQYGVSLRGPTTQTELSGNNTRGNALGRVNRDSSVTGTRFGHPDSVVKPGTTTLNNTGTLTADPHLQLVVDPNSTYLMESFIVYTATATADWKGGYYGPSGAALLWSTDAVASADTSNGASAQVNRQGASLSSAPSHGGAGGQSLIAKHTGRLTVGSTGGTFGLQWCQTTAEASDATVQPGSWIRLTRVA